MKDIATTLDFDLVVREGNSDMSFFIGDYNQAKNPTEKAITTTSYPRKFKDMIRFKRRNQPMWHVNSIPEVPHEEKVLVDHKTGKVIRRVIVMYMNQDGTAATLAADKANPGLASLHVKYKQLLQDYAELFAEVWVYRRKFGQMPEEQYKFVLRDTKNQKNIKNNLFSFGERYSQK